MRKIDVPRTRLYLEVPNDVKIYLKSMAAVELTTTQHLVLLAIAASYPETRTELEPLFMAEHERQTRLKELQERENTPYENANK